MEERAAVLAVLAECSVLRDEVERLREELAALKGPADEKEIGGPPDELWLQWHGDDEGNYLWPDDADRAGVTWSRHQVWRHDVRYVRADDTTAAPDEEEE